MTVVVEGKKTGLYAVKPGVQYSTNWLNIAKSEWRKYHPGQPLPTDDWFAAQRQGR